jgi:uncharacterized membrane protein
MQEHHSEQETIIRYLERLPAGLRHPLAIGLLAIVAAAALWRMGYVIGGAAHDAFDGEGLMAAAFGATLVTVLVVIIAVGVLLDRRQRTRDADAAPLTDTQHQRLRAYVRPASPLVRWYQPAAVAVFAALAAPGAWLLDTPWDGLWVLAVLVANPVARWLRARGHVLTTRDLGFPVPGLSPWPSIAYAAIAATTGMAVAVLLWAEALDTTLASTITGIALVAVIAGGGLAIERHQRRHITHLLGDQPH